ALQGTAGRRAPGDARALSFPGLPAPGDDRLPHPPGPRLAGSRGTVDRARRPGGTPAPGALAERSRTMRLSRVPRDPATTAPLPPEGKLDLPGLGRLYRAFAGEYRKYRGALGLAGLSLLAFTAVGALEPWPLKLILDRVILRRPLPHRLAFLAHAFTDPRLLLLWLALAIVAVAALKA